MNFLQHSRIFKKPTKLELTESCGSLTYDIIKDKKVRKNVELKETDFNQVVKILNFGIVFY